MRTGLAVIGFATALASLSATPAHALLNRAWVSGRGSDTAGCGAVQTPCRTLQYVHDSIIAGGGEINILDAAGYGPLVINKGLSVLNGGGGVAATQSITINAVAYEHVVLQGLTIEGGGINGIVYNSGGNLFVFDCLIQRYEDYNEVGTPQGNAIKIAPASGSWAFLIARTRLLNNSGAGVLYQPPANSTAVSLLELDDVVASGGYNYGALARNSASSGRLTIRVSNSTFSGNNLIGLGFSSTGGSINANVDGSSIVGNGDGLLVSGSASAVYLGRTIVSGNKGGGVVIQNGGTVTTFSDNRISRNSPDVAGSLTPGVLQ